MITDHTTLAELGTLLTQIEGRLRGVESKIGIRSEQSARPPLPPGMYYCDGSKIDLPDLKRTLRKVFPDRENSPMTADLDWGAGDRGVVQRWTHPSGAELTFKKATCKVKVNLKENGRVDKQTLESVERRGARAAVLGVLGESAYKMLEAMDKIKSNTSYLEEANPQATEIVESRFKTIEEKFEIAEREFANARVAFKRAQQLFKPEGATPKRRDHKSSK